MADVSWFDGPWPLPERRRRPFAELIAELRERYGDPDLMRTEYVPVPHQTARAAREAQGRR